LRQVIDAHVARHGYGGQLSNLDRTFANYVTTENLSRSPIDDQLAEPSRSAINNRAGGGFEIDAGGGDIMLFSGFGFR